MNQMNFEFSDTIAGYVQEYNKEQDTFVVKTTDDREYVIKIGAETYGWIANTPGEPRTWLSRDQMRAMLEPGRYLFAYGIFYPEKGGHTIETQFMVFPGKKVGTYGFERQNWWIQQIDELGKFYLKAQFGEQALEFEDDAYKKAIDYDNYRTTIKLSGEKEKDNYRQETDTISRMVYGFASAYMLTGDDRFLEGAEKGTQYLRDHMRFYDADENIVYWYHGIDVHGKREDKVFASEFGDDFDAIPCYEQIYALAGPIQTYRVTGDPQILKDAEMTVDLFDRFYLDKAQGGYFSHLDPIMLDPRSESLGANKGKKNWNSVGDHAPAYLINLYLATGEKRYADFLEYTFDTIEKYFPDYENSPFVQEKFFEDWSHDNSHLWQKTRGVVGHNLKIAWNITRMHNLKPKDKYVTFARKIAEEMAKVGMDTQRGGWYDVMERKLRGDEEVHRFAFHDRKAWWQQEQGILAYQIMHGVFGDEIYLKLARESAAFYNAFFLDHDDGGVYFNVLNNGLPYLMGTERFKGSHSMSFYHSSELCFLAAVYINLLITKQPLELYFKPYPNGFKRNILRVSPDILPPGSIKIAECWIDDEPYTNFEVKALTVKLPDTKKQVRVKVRIEPTK
ncbi:Slr1855 protein [Candidatus Vecturithrix granuli]|uniref:Slr1855 protein n=1 Tax=Vecturithrix granuli TaxID=1499967 RepID=A0A0S6WAW6_VECG1|nr:Slr1855 protein [Candidatus Vecturithrix granuli]